MRFWPILLEHLPAWAVGASIIYVVVIGATAIYGILSMFGGVS